MNFESELTEFLAETNRLISKVEENMLTSLKTHPVSLAEAHAIEAVGKDKEGRSITELANDLDIALPSVTAAIWKLAKRGFVEKLKDENDKRVVKVKLTKLGERVNMVHRLIHERMVDEIIDAFTEEERALIFKMLQRINNFFRDKLEENR